jgi:hypothetical protein
MSSGKEERFGTKQSADGEYSQDGQGEGRQDEVFKLAPFNPSSDQIQQKALEIMKLSEEDVLFDLGCGDGRFLCNAAEKCPGLRCIGIEIDPVFAARAKLRVSELPPDVGSRIDIREEDALKPSAIISKHSYDNQKNDIRHMTLMEDATVLYLFVLPKGIKQLIDMLNNLLQRRMDDGRRFRVLSYMFEIHEWKPTIIDKTAKGGCPIYYYEFGP